MFAIGRRRQTETGSILFLYFFLYFLFAFFFSSFLIKHMVFVENFVSFSTLMRWGQNTNFRFRKDSFSAIARMQRKKLVSDERRAIKTRRDFLYQHDASTKSL